VRDDECCSWRLPRPEFQNPVDSGPAVSYDERRNQEEVPAMTPETPLSTRRPIGFVPSVTGVPTIRMEEAADGEEYERHSRGSAEIVRQWQSMAERLCHEREEILDLIKNQKLSVKEGAKLLQANSQLIERLRGGYSFGTEKVIYSILIFSGIVIVILSCLTAFLKLPEGVTTTFVGTVVGGTIATIAQKLGKIGR
jgi:hypothetical protein